MLNTPMNLGRFGPGSFRPGSFRPIFGVGRFGPESNFNRDRSSIG